MNIYTNHTQTSPLRKVMQKGVEDKMQEWKDLHDTDSRVSKEYFNAIIGHLAASELATETARKAIQVVELLPYYRQVVKQRAKALRTAITKFDALTALSMEEGDSADAYDLMVEAYNRIMRRHVEILRQTIVRSYQRADILHAEELAACETARIVMKMVNKMARVDADALFFLVRPYAVGYTERIEAALEAFCREVVKAEDKYHPYGEFDLNTSPDTHMALKVLYAKFRHGVAEELRADIEAHKLINEETEPLNA